jgi:Bacterial Ig-like domain
MGGTTHAARRTRARAVRRLTLPRRTLPRRTLPCRCLVAPAVIGFFGLVAACASEQFPPGGPILHTTPKITATIPESNAVNVKTSHVVIKFDRVMAETPQGASSLELMFLISPWTGTPNVDWHRDHITITPKKGYRRNTAYTVTMLPGVTDLHSNAIKTPFALTFSTGSTIPETVIRGVVFDWVANKVAAKAVVEAIARPDTSTVYITLADSNGRFALRHVPPGTYLIRGWLDANSNRKLDQREVFDSTTLTFTDSATTELLGFIHDTIGPRVGDVKVVDSVTLRATFDKALDTTQTISSLHLGLKAKDSTSVPIAKVLASQAYDSLQGARRKAHDDSLARIDSLRRADSGVTGRDTLALRRRAALRQSRRDSVALASRAKPSRRPPTTEIVVELGEPLKPGQSYRISADSVRNLQHRVRSSNLAFTIPKVPSKDSLVRADSLRAAKRKGGGARPTPPPKP